VTPRLLTIMGSGETAPTMVKVHRSVVERLGPGTAPGLLLDTPFGFQTNAAEIASRAVTYFRDSVGSTIEVAGLRRKADLEGPAGDAIVAKLAAAPLVFAGPGSPTYALRQWQDTLVPGLLAEKLALGGALTFASAAALTLGCSTVPVYEVYKVGEDPRWVPGLDLLTAIGLRVALIPHYDNTEGGTHDTRFCYLGEQRLAKLEHELPEGAFVLGVDEHSALCIDLDAQRAEVVGHGGVTVRVLGRSIRIEPGEAMALGRIVELAAELAAQPAAGRGTGSTGPDGPGGPGAAAPVDVGTPSAPGGDGPPLLGSIRRLEETFRGARGASDVGAMVETILALDDELWAWSADTLQSDALDRGRASLRAMVAELGELAALGARDPAGVVGPFVDLALSLRDSARRERRFGDADAVRDGLVALGIEINDTPDGSAWHLPGNGASA
jgi:cyanophycinase-like exopeptidase